MKCPLYITSFFIINGVLASVKLQEFSSRNNLFAVSFYKQLQNHAPSNFLMSPFSLQSVLAFVQSGCKDETAEEIRASLYLSEDNAQTEAAIQESFSALIGNKSYKLAIANKIYVKKGFVIRDEFQATAANIYKADVEEIKFARKAKAANKMNKWVEHRTNDKIHNLVDSETLDNRTRSVLINAIFFKGPWAQKFDAAATKSRDFHKNSQETVKIDTMLLKGKMFGYYENPELDAKFLEMRFRGGDVSMIAALPNENDGLAALESQIEKVFAVQDFKSERVTVALPKFRVESRFELTPVLKNMGIRKIFDKDEADLSGIAGEKGELVIGDVIHQTYIDVREGGVEAAGATSAQIVVPHSLPLQAKRPKQFIADHPFLFYVKAKGFIIFAGRFSGPD